MFCAVLFRSSGASNCVARTKSVVQEKQVRKLGFREKDEYAKLEKQIEDATEQKVQLEAQIAETAQLGDFEKVASLTEQLPVLSDKIDTMTDRYRPLLYPQP